jgi:predicted transcriptional regulator
MSQGMKLNDEVERKLKALCEDETRNPTAMVTRLIHLAYVKLINRKSEDKKGSE